MDYRPGVRVLGVRRVAGHVRDGQAFGHVHTQVVGPGEGRHELGVEGGKQLSMFNSRYPCRASYLKSVWGETSDQALPTPYEDELLPHRQTVGTGEGR